MIRGGKAPTPSVAKIFRNLEAKEFLYNHATLYSFLLLLHLPPHGFSEIESCLGWACVVPVITPVIQPVWVAERVLPSGGILTRSAPEKACMSKSCLGREELQSGKTPGAGLTSKEFQSPLGNRVLDST